MAGKLEITIKGNKDLLKYLNTLGKKNPAKAKEVLTKACILVESEAKKNVLKEGLKDTGKLQTHITHAVIHSGNALFGVVGTNTDYAAIWEKGPKSGLTKRVLAPVGEKWARRHGFPPGTKFLWVTLRKRPFLDPALRDNQGRITRLVANEYSKFIKTGK